MMKFLKGETESDRDHGVVLGPCHQDYKAYLVAYDRTLTNPTDVGDGAISVDSKFQRRK
jgi:hypothetical protein